LPISQENGQDLKIEADRLPLLWPDFQTWKEKLAVSDPSRVVALSQSLHQLTCLIEVIAETHTVSEFSSLHLSEKHGIINM
jgi:hypothetical protein